MSFCPPTPFEGPCRSIDHLRDTLDHAHPESSNSYEPDRSASKAPVPPPMVIVLQGMAVSGRTTAFDFILPHARRSALAVGPVKHLDVISCWKGATLPQAWELAAWDSLFKECLAGQIKDHFQLEFCSSLRGVSPPRTPSIMVERMMYFLEHAHPMWINVDMTRLVDDMIGQMYNTYRTDTAQRRFSWTLSSGDLPSFVYNYAHAQDCLNYSIDGPRVCASLSSRYSQGDIIVYVDLHWQYERTAFLGLRDRLSCGKSYRITPYNKVAGDGCNDRCNFSRVISEVTYSVGKSPLPLQWDDQQECFHSVVHRGSQDQDGLIVTEVSARISTPFHAGVRFERISRYMLKLEVEEDNLSLRSPPMLCDEAAASLPRKHGSPWVPSYTSTPLSKTGFEAQGQADIAQMHCSIRQQEPRLRRMAFGSQPNGLTMERIKQLIHDGTLSQMEDAQDDKASLNSSPVSHFECQCPSHRPGTSHGGYVGGSQPNATPEELPSGRQDSPGKRKTPQLDTSPAELNGSFALDKAQSPDLTVDPKRRKVVQDEDQDIIMNEGAVNVWLDSVGDGEEVVFNHLARISTGLMGNAQSSKSTWHRKLEYNRPHSPVKTVASSSASKSHVASVGGNKQTSFVWPNPYYTQRSPAVRVDEVLDDSHDEISPTTASTAASLDTISQEQIQLNYQEFEQRQRQKAAEKAFYAATIPGFDGVVSPIDVEGKTFENIFLGDDKSADAGDWVSATDDVSEGMSHVSLDD